MHLNELDEVRQDAFQHTILVQNQRSKWLDKFIKNKSFQLSDWALLFDSRYKNFKGKLTTRWLGPYEVSVVYDNGSVKIKSIDESNVSFTMNGHRLKIYHKPLSKAEFIQEIINRSGLKLVEKGSSSGCPPLHCSE